jgi:hypothetical protein
MNGRRDRIIEERINEIGRECFPEDADVRWTALRISHVGSYSYVEAEADPPTVGYPRFVFVLLFGASEQPSIAGCYEGDGVRWDLLFTAPDTPADWQDVFPKAKFTEELGKFSSHERERIIRERINDICQESFPDDTDVSWTVLRITHESKYSFVECEPDSTEVGYPKFVLVLTFTESGKAREEGCYAFERGRWDLLSSSSDSSEWQHLFLDSEWGKRRPPNASSNWAVSACMALFVLALGAIGIWVFLFYINS